MPVASNLNIASGNSITIALSNLRTTYNGRNAWLDSGANKYVIDTINTIGTDLANSTLHSSQMVDYMATSVLIHCFNGWTYLSGAINSLIEGDYPNAIHNAYYAELRSAISILASQGIGVFDKKNVLIDIHGHAHKVTPPSVATHLFVKTAFDEWINDTNNSQKLLSLINIDKTSLKDWIYHTGFSNEISGQLAAVKLKEWSLDIATFKNEGKFRNFVSYNPMRIEMFPAAIADNLKDRYRFIVDLWKLCAPNELFGYSILRNSYEKLYATQAFLVKDLDMKSDWERIFTDLGRNVHDVQSQNIINFLQRNRNPNDNIIFNYADNITPSVPFLESDVEPYGIISRACIMLLLNTKIVESLIRQSGTSKTDLRFWFDNIGIKSGYWEPAAAPNSFTDLWSDVEMDIEDIENWMSNPANRFDAYNSKSALKNSTTHIRNFGKAYLWNSGL